MVDVDPEAFLSLSVWGELAPLGVQGGTGLGAVAQTVKQRVDLV